jgi:hypothetical protein
MKQHTEDYKLTAVKYYLHHNEDMRDTCDIFKCNFQSLSRWVKIYKQNGNLNRKTRKNHNLKITPFTLMDVNEVPNFISFLTMNGYLINTNITQMLNNGNIQFGNNQTLFFVSY